MNFIQMPNNNTQHRHSIINSSRIWEPSVQIERDVYEIIAIQVRINIYWQTKEFV